MLRNQSHQLFVGLAINGRGCDSGEPRTIAQFFEPAVSRIRLYFDPEGFHDINIGASDFRISFKKWRGSRADSLGGYRLLLGLPKLNLGSIRVLNPGKPAKGVLVVAFEDGNTLRGQARDHRVHVVDREVDHELPR